MQLNPQTPSTSSPWQSKSNSSSKSSGPGPGGSYDPDKFYTRATNSHDHGEKLTFKVPPEIYARLANLIDKDFPDYKSIPDACRDLLAHGLVMREDQSGSLEVKKYAKMFRAQLEADRLADVLIKRTEWFEGYVLKTDKMMTGLFGNEDYPGIRQGLTDMCEIAAGQDEPYRGKILENVEKWGKKLPPEERDELGSIGEGTLFSS